MLYIVLMISGALTGLVVGRDGHTLWGLLLGLVLAHAIRLGQRVTRLERAVEARKQPSSSPAEQSPVPSPPPPGEPRAPTEDGRKAAPEDAGALGWAREAAPPAQASGPEPPRERPEAPPTPPSEPGPRRAGWLARGLAAIASFFTTGNPLVRVGALVLFVGVAFLLKYLAERVTVPIEMRLMSIAAGGLAMVGAGLVLRRRRPGFALPFQGAGVGVLYLTTYAAVRLYPVLPPSVALGILLLVVALTIALALLQDAPSLATFGVVGGFLAPVLASTGQGSHVELFSFYLILNVVIGVIAWFRAWRWLNWLGFVFTFGIASLWGAQYYRPEHFATTEPFLLAHVALYLAVAVLFATRQPPRLKGWVDGTLVFGTPILGFTLQALLLEGQETALAASAAVFGLVYLLLRQFLLLRDREHFQLLGQSFLALGAGFLTLAIPLAFDARVTSAMWTLEGAAVAWVGIRQASRVRRWAGYALMGLGSLAYLIENDFGGRSALIFLNADFIGIAIIALGFLFVADRIRRHRADPRWPQLPAAMWLYGSAWWWLGGLVELERQLTGAVLLLTTVTFFAVGMLLMAEYGRRRAFAAAKAVAIFAGLTLALMALVWRAPEIGPLLRNVNTLAAAGVLAALTACGLRLAPPESRGGWSSALAAVGLGLWLLSGLIEIDSRFGGAAQLHAGLIFVSLSLLAGSLASGPLRWPQWRRCVEVMSVVPAITLLLIVSRHAQPLAGIGAVAWPLAFAVLYGLLRWRERADFDGLDRLHAVAFWSLVALLTHAVQFHAEAALGADSAWRLASLGGVPLLLAGLVQWPVLRRAWPLNRHIDSYTGEWLGPVMVWLVGWLAVSNTAPPGDFSPTPYWPVLNVQDGVSIGSLWLIVHWWKRTLVARDEGTARVAGVLIGLLAFGVLNAALLRALHFHLPIEWDFDRMLGSFTVQASLTLLWVGISLVAMVIGSRSLQRWLWMVGAALMAVVVAKLFLVDTAASGTLARIAAFFGVAIGLFVAGYFAPRPPARTVKGS